jgi:hypothetical protein
MVNRGWFNESFDFSEAIQNWIFLRIQNAIQAIFTMKNKNMSILIQTKPEPRATGRADSDYRYPARLLLENGIWV